MIHRLRGEGKQVGTHAWGPGAIRCGLLACARIRDAPAPARGSAAPSALTRQSSWEMGLLLPGWLMSQIFTHPLPPV